MDIGYCARYDIHGECDVQLLERWQKKISDNLESDLPGMQKLRLA